MRFKLPAQSILSNYQYQFSYLDKPNQWSKVALRVWFKTCKRFHLEKHARILKWVTYDPEFKPSGLDMRFRQWALKCVTAYCTITTGNCLEPFNHLSNAYNLGKKDFFRYLQVRDYFSKGIKQTEDTEPNLINIDYKTSQISLLSIPQATIISM